MNIIIHPQHISKGSCDIVEEKTTVHYKRSLKNLIPYGVLLALASCSQTAQGRSQFMKVNNYEKITPLIIPREILINYRLPKDNEGIIRKERRNKQRVIDRNRDISPYKNYYQQ